MAHSHINYITPVPGWVWQNRTSFICSDNTSNSKITTGLTFGPYLCNGNRFGKSKAASGVIIDIYSKSGDVPAIGAGKYTTVTGESGLVYFGFSEDCVSDIWVVRSHFPAGVFDITKPDFILEYTEELFKW